MDPNQDPNHDNRTLDVLNRYRKHKLNQLIENENLLNLDQIYASRK